MGGFFCLFESKVSFSESFFLKKIIFIDVREREREQERHRFVVLFIYAFTG